MRASSAAKESGAVKGLTDMLATEPAHDRAQSWRSFTDEQKLTIVLQCEGPGVTVSSVARMHQLATSVLFRWRADLGFGRKQKVKLATVRASDSASDSDAEAMVLHDLLQPPDGMAAVDLPDGRRVFAPSRVQPASRRGWLGRRWL